MGYTELTNEFSRNSEETETHFERTSFSLQQLLDEVVDELLPYAEKISVKIKVVVSPKLPLTMSSDPVRLKLVLVNIIGGALRFAQESEMAVLVECVKVSSNYAQLLQVTVKTKSLYLTENSLELYQTKKVAKILGGDVFLKYSSPDLGASFVATFLVNDESNPSNSSLRH